MNKQSTLREAVIKMLDFAIVIGEMNQTIDDKNKAVREQDFLAAANARDKENELREQLPTMEDLLAIREKLKTQHK